MKELNEYAPWVEWPRRSSIRDKEKRGDLSGRGARGDLVRNKLQMRINWPSLNQPDDCIRRLQPGSMRKINCYRVSDLANAAVLVFKRPAVPVARSLQRERHHDECQQRGQQPVSDAPPIH
jgi:hypothetical protein